MIHIFKHSDGTFDRATVRKGKYIHGSNQGYKRKIDVLMTIVKDLSDVYAQVISNNVFTLVQDDTGDKPVLCTVNTTKPYLVISKKQPKNMKKYIPNQYKSKKK